MRSLLLRMWVWVSICNPSKEQRLCPYVGSSGDIVVKTAVTRCIVPGLASDVKVQIVVSREDKESAYSGQIGNSTSANPLGRLAKTNSRG